MLSILNQDFRRYSNHNGNIIRYALRALISAEFRAVVFYRIGRFFRLKRCPIIPGLCERFMHHLCHCWISTGADIGPGFLISHVGCIGIGSGTRMGKNCDVRRGVILGGNYSKKDEEGRTKPWLGDNVSIGVGAKILGPVKVGSNVIIGANSVVTRDIPDDVIVFGVPAKVIKKKWPQSTGRGL